MSDDKLKGKVNQAKGGAKETWGNLTDDHEKVAEGKMDKNKGKVQQKVGEVKDKLKNKD